MALRLALRGFDLQDHAFEKPIYEDLENAVGQGCRVSLSGHPIGLYEISLVNGYRLYSILPLRLFLKGTVYTPPPFEETDKGIST